MDLRHESLLVSVCVCVGGWVGVCARMFVNILDREQLHTHLPTPPAGQLRAALWVRRSAGGWVGGCEAPRKVRSTGPFLFFLSI